MHTTLGKMVERNGTTINFSNLKLVSKAMHCPILDSATMQKERIGTAHPTVRNTAVRNFMANDFPIEGERVHRI